MKKWLKLTIRYLLFAVVSVIVGVNIYTAISAKLAGNAVPMPFGIGTSVVMSGSMEPNLSVGDIIIVKESETYEVGDVVVFQTVTTATVHRIVIIDGESIITKGDANNVEDDSIDITAVKGKVIFSIPFVGYIVLFLQSPIGVIIVIALAVLLLELSYKNEKKKKEDDLEELKKEVQLLRDENNQE